MAEPGFGTRSPDHIFNSCSVTGAGQKELGDFRDIGKKEASHPVI